jgi:hypothetical protein
VTYVILVAQKDFVVVIIFVFLTDSAMFSPFRPLEEYAGPSILTVGALCFFFFLSVKIFSSEFVCFPFVERDICSVTRILEYVSIYTAIAL